MALRATNISVVRDESLSLPLRGGLPLTTSTFPMEGLNEFDQAFL
jgi:hypothetical protein